MFEILIFVGLFVGLIAALGLPYPDITYGRGIRH
jgi:hypothetical protein